VSLSELTGDETLSTQEINDEAQAFFRKYGEITKLAEKDQKLLQSLIDRFKVEEDES
jgi:hypothetical protein